MMLFYLLTTAFAGGQTPAAKLDLGAVAPDLNLPVVQDGPPGAGKRVKQSLPRFENTALHHLLYLPTDWKPGKSLPVIVEYPGNEYKKVGYHGRIEDCKLGYGASGGKGVIWLALPFVNSQAKAHQLKWWGDREATIAYCQDAVELVCDRYGGDRSKLILAGFSRGAIACNYIGLGDEQIAKLWRGFICHSHYDGVRNWGYAGSDRAAALKRLERLAGRPQFISHESSTAETEKYLQQTGIRGEFTFVPLPFVEHTDVWVLRDVEPRRRLRAWLKKVLEGNTG